MAAKVEGDCSTVMKVFEVITEHDGEDKKIETMRQYVTQKDGSLAKVADYFEKHCEEYEEEFISVRYICTIVQHIE